MASSASGTPAMGMKTRVYELENEVDSLKGKISDLRAQRNEIQEKSDRRLKDFENYKYRMDRERRGAFIDQISNLATQMLPVLDNFDRVTRRTVTPLRSFSEGSKLAGPVIRGGIDMYTLDLNKVNALMTAAGWAKGSDGIWAKKGG